MQVRTIRGLLCFFSVFAFIVIHRNSDYLFIVIVSKYKICSFCDYSVETNFISPVGIVCLVKSLLKQRALEEFRATNQVNFKTIEQIKIIIIIIFFVLYFQRSQVLGNKIEMELTKLIEQNPTILRLGLHLEYNDARHRIASHLQRNIDRSKYSLHHKYNKNVLNPYIIIV